MTFFDAEQKSLATGEEKEEVVREILLVLIVFVVLMALPVRMYRGILRDITMALLGCLFLTPAVFAGEVPTAPSAGLTAVQVEVLAAGKPEPGVEITFTFSGPAGAVDIKAMKTDANGNAVMTMPPGANCARVELDKRYQYRLPRQATMNSVGQPVLRSMNPYIDRMCRPADKQRDILLRGKFILN